GHAASENEPAARQLFRRRRRFLQFANHLNASFCLRPELESLPKDETFVCRCEDVPFKRLKTFKNWRDAKLQTRCGMGPCQGRVCGPAAEFLFGWTAGGPRPPLLPVRLDRIALEEKENEF
ncbi:MAG: hypothetical protein OEQ28_13955, partial [Acidobacteriota bacterium]|nr:hypothetical protein [Acidobacteriota bacterium]